MLSRPWPRRLTPDRARPWFGEPPPRCSTSCYDRLRQPLRRPLEPGQYLSIKYTERLAAAGIEPSVGSVGDSGACPRAAHSADPGDNALAETINGLYKAELIHRRGPWRSVEAVEFATLEWVDWFNNRRLLGPIGNRPPVKAEAAYYAPLEMTRIAA